MHITHYLFKCLVLCTLYTSFSLNPAEIPGESFTSFTSQFESGLKTAKETINKIWEKMWWIDFELWMSIRIRFSSCSSLCRSQRWGKRNNFYQVHFGSDKAHLQIAGILILQKQNGKYPLSNGSSSSFCTEVWEAELHSLHNKAWAIFPHLQAKSLNKEF